MTKCGLLLSIALLLMLSVGLPPLWTGLETYAATHVAQKTANDPDDEDEDSNLDAACVQEVNACR